MSGFSYRNGMLHAEGIGMAEIADAVGTPTYVYSAGAIRDAYRAYEDAFGGQKLGIHYAVKANGNLAILALLANLGSGADIVSLGEMRRALKAGIPASHLVFSGVGKTDEELHAAVSEGVGQINVESEAELAALSQVAQSLGRRQRIALRINPDVDALTHEKISTGKKGDKFGIDYDQAQAAYAHAAKMPGLQPVGIAMHIGSQLTEIAPYRAAYTRAADLVRALRADGHTVDSIDLGGGIGVTYNDEVPLPIADYANAVLDSVGNLGCTLAIEPGRSIVGPAGMLLTRAIFTKPGHGSEVLVLDAGMNDLVRPSMYDAYHPILPVKQPAPDAKTAPVDVVGPVCETGDMFAKGRDLPAIERGDLVAIGVAGAYGASMSSTYNARPLAAEVLVDNDKFHIIRPRQSIEAMFADERIPAGI